MYLHVLSVLTLPVRVRVRVRVLQDDQASYLLQQRRPHGWRGTQMSGAHAAVGFAAPSNLPHTPAHHGTRRHTTKREGGSLLEFLRIGRVVEQVFPQEANRLL